MKTHSDKQNRTCSNCGEWVETGTKHVPYLGGPYSCSLSHSSNVGPSGVR
jgi:hypothetical protein